MQLNNKVSIATPGMDGFIISAHCSLVTIHGGQFAAFTRQQDIMSLPHVINIFTKILLAGSLRVLSWDHCYS